LGGASYGTFNNVEYCVGQTTDVHDGSLLEFDVQFSTVQAVEKVLLGKWKIADANREFLLDLIGGRLTLIISPDGLTFSVYTIGSELPVVNDGDWHRIEGKWESLGATGQITGTIDGVAFTTIPTTQGVIYNGDGAYTVGANSDGTFDWIGGIACTHINDLSYCLSEGWGGKVYEENGGFPLQITNATLATFWSLDTGSDVYPRNFLLGFWLYENGTPGEEIRTPYLLDTGDIPAGYSLSAEIPPNVFGPWEGWFKVPYDVELENSDENGKLFTGGVPNEIYYATLVAGGFGDYIGYTDYGTYYKKFWVKKKPSEFNVIFDTENVVYGADNAVYEEV